MKFGKRLKEARQEKNLSQEQLAEQLGVSAITVSRWERDTTAPNVEQAAELCGILGIEINMATEKEASAAQATVAEEELSAAQATEPAHKQKGLPDKTLILILTVVFLLAVTALLWVILHGMFVIPTPPPPDEGETIIDYQYSISFSWFDFTVFLVSSILILAIIQLTVYYIVKRVRLKKAEKEKNNEKKR